MVSNNGTTCLTSSRREYILLAMVYLKYLLGYNFQEFQKVHI